MRGILKTIITRLYQSLRRDNYHIRPSSIGGCPRKNVLLSLHPIQKDGIDELTPDQLAEVGAAVGGVILERFLEPIFKEMGFRYQVRIITDYAQGTCDFYYYNPDDESAIVLDTKTTNRSSLPYLPHQAHLDQLQVYMDGILHGEIYETIRTEDGQELLGERLPNPKSVEGCLLYFLRENPLFIGTDAQEYWISYDPDYAQKLRRRFQKLRECVEKGEIPPIPSGYSPFQFPCYISSHEGIFRCPFWEMCWEGVLEKSAAPPELLQVAQEYLTVNEMHKFYGKERRRLANTLKSLAISQPIISLPSGIIKKVVVERSDVDYKSLLSDFLKYIGENPNIPMDEKLKIVRVYNQLKQQHTRTRTEVRFYTFTGLREEGEGEELSPREDEN